VCHIIFSAIQCDDLGLMGKLLSYDYRVDCNSAEYQRFWVYALMMIFVWPLGYPLALLGLLWYLKVPQLASSKLRSQKWQCFLMDAVRRLVATGKDTMGISVDVAPKDLTLPQLQVLTRMYDLPLATEIDEALVKQLDAHITGMVQQEQLALPVLCWDPESSNQQENTACRWLGAVFLDYEPQYWWWEVAETLRKLVLISVLTVVNEDATSYLWMAFLVSLFALICQGACRPFSEPFLDKVQACSQLVTCCTIFCTLLSRFS
jgi:hypothetical protein